MKVTKKMVVFLAGIFLLTLTAYFFMYKGSGHKQRHGQKRQQGQGQGQGPQLNIQPIPLPQPNTTPDVNVLPTIPRMPTVRDMPPDNVIANFPDLDRQPLDDETLALLPANEMITYNYKEWDGGSGNGSNGSVDKELYAKGNPLFNQNGAAAPLVPLDINGEKRRINFY